MRACLALLFLAISFIQPAEARQRPKLADPARTELIINAGAVYCRSLSRSGEPLTVRFDLYPIEDYVHYHPPKWVHQITQPITLGRDWTIVYAWTLGVPGQPDAKCITLYGRRK
jgi:hypothetical protein